MGALRFEKTSPDVRKRDELRINGTENSLPTTTDHRTSSGKVRTFRHTIRLDKYMRMSLKQRGPSLSPVFLEEVMGIRNNIEHANY